MNMRPLLGFVALLVSLAAAPVARAGDAGLEGFSLADEGPTAGWSGRRNALAESGVDIGLTVYNDFVSIVDGGLEQDNYSPGLIEPTVGLDLGPMFGWDGSHVFVRGLGMYGMDPVAGTGSLDAPSNLANSVPTFRLFEAWFEQRFLDDTWSVRLGLYAVDSEFDVKETAGVFMNGGFGTGVDLSQSGVSGPCIYPTSCLGARLQFLPTADTYLRVALLDGVAGDPDDPHGTHLVFNNHRYGVFTIAEGGYQRPSDEGRFLRAAVGVWYYSAAFDDVKEVDGAGDPRRRHANPGAYALLEGELHRDPESPGEGLSGFVRIGLADPDVNQVRYFVSAGLVDTGLVPGRGEDVTAVGVSVPINGRPYESAQRKLDAAVADAEVALELTHYVPLLPWVSVQFDAQYVVDPGTDATVADALLLGMRCKITF